jgi:hypothetical protein
MIFEVGKEYLAILNGKARKFKVLINGSLNWGRPGEFLIRWDDGEEEWAYLADMERWTRAFRWMQEDAEASRRGGRREGAGRPSIGVSKPFKLTLEQEAWDWIDECVRRGDAASRADLLRQLIDRARGK